MKGSVKCGLLAWQPPQQGGKMIGHAVSCQVVEDVDDLLVVAHQARSPHHRQLLRDVGLWFAQDGREMADALFVTPQQIEDPQARGMGHGFQPVGLLPIEVRPLQYLRLLSYRGHVGPMRTFSHNGRFL